jgi:hypothetical protein
MTCRKEVLKMIALMPLFWAFCSGTGLCSSHLDFAAPPPPVRRFTKVHQYARQDALWVLPDPPAADCNKRALFAGLPLGFSHKPLFCRCLRGKSQNLFSGQWLLQNVTA